MSHHRASIHVRKKLLRGEVALSSMRAMARSAFTLLLLACVFAFVIHYYALYVIIALFAGYYHKALVFDTLVILNSLKNVIGLFDWWSKVDDMLYLGAVPLREAHNKQLLDKLKIQVVLSINEDYELKCPTLFGVPTSSTYWHQNKVSHLVLPSPDFVPPNLKLLDRAADYLDLQLSNRRPVYVHCKAGVGRSASAVMAYFIKYKRMSVPEAHAALKRARRHVFGASSPNYRNMEKYSESLFGSTNKNN